MAVKSRAIDPEQLAQAMAETRAAYDASKVRTDRVYGTTFGDVWWERPWGRKIKRISTGDGFQHVDYNGGYPSYLILKHGDRIIEADYRTLDLDAHRDEPIVLVGQKRAYKQPTLPWTIEELKLVASFFQTLRVERRRDDVARLRSTRYVEQAEALERLQAPRVSVVVDEDGLISRKSGL